MQYQKTKEQLVHEVLENFDFDKVQKTMQFLDWKWVDSKGGFRVPGTIKLMLAAKNYLELAYDGLCKADYKNDEYFVACGGFEVRAKRYYDALNAPDILLILNFNLATWEAATYDR